MSFTEADVLYRLNLVNDGSIPDDYPKGGPTDIRYSFFLDLEHGYCEMAASKIHLFTDESRWAVVFETCGYKNRALRAEIDLFYIGNCVTYHIETYPDRNYISNLASIELISYEEYERICNINKDSGEPDFELINPLIKEIALKGHVVPIEHDIRRYHKLNIPIRDYDNPNELIGFGEILKYFNETSPEVISATEEDIIKSLPPDLPKLLTIDAFNVENNYGEPFPPSEQELYKLISKVLVSRDPNHWKPTLPPNNHWSNWQSGWL
jgi:hypothetical protein